VDRVPDSGPGGRGFNSRHAYKKSLQKNDGFKKYVEIEIFLCYILYYLGKIGADMASTFLRK
jgi:hypothetical protein